MDTAAATTPSAPATQTNASTNAPPPSSASAGQQPPPNSGGSGGPSSSSGSPEVFEVKVNGKTVKMTRQEVLDHASMSHAANSKFNEAAQQRRAVEKILATAKENPIQALMDPALGLTKDQIRDAFETWYSAEYIEPETLTADQRQLREYESKLKKYQDDEKNAQLRAENEKQEKLTTHQREYLQQQIVDAMESSGLPKTKFFASRMAFYMRQNLKNGWEAPMEMIVRQVKQERNSMLGDLNSNATAEQLIEALGEDVINKIRRHDLESLRKKRQLPGFSDDGSGNQNSGSSFKPGEKVYSSDVNRRLREMRRGL